MGALKLISVRTWSILALGLAITVTFRVLFAVGPDVSGPVASLLANLPSLLTSGLAAGVALWAATRFSAGESLRRQWLYVAAGVGLLFLGDAVYAVLEMRQEVPFPSAADFFYLISFPAFGAGLGAALLAFRRSLDLRRPVLLSAVLTGSAVVALWATLFAPILSDGEATLTEKLLGVFYPVGDLALLIFPAFALAMALSRFGAGRVAWPWWWVTVGLGLIATSDTLFTLAENAGTYESGSLLDIGWWLGYLAIGIGASLLVDLQRPRTGGRS